MKKIVSLVVLMSALTLSMQAQGVKFGLKIGRSTVTGQQYLVSRLNIEL